MTPHELYELAKPLDGIMAMPDGLFYSKPTRTWRLLAEPDTVTLKPSTASDLILAACVKWLAGRKASCIDFMATRQANPWAQITTNGKTYGGDSEVEAAIAAILSLKEME